MQTQTLTTINNKTYFLLCSVKNLINHFFYRTNHKIKCVKSVILIVFLSNSRNFLFKQFFFYLQFLSLYFFLSSLIELYQIPEIRFVIKKWRGGVCIKKEVIIKDQIIFDQQKYQNYTATFLKQH